jgi:hypothetical protein
MRLIQFVSQGGRPQVAAITDEHSAPRIVEGATSVRELALQAARSNTTLAACIAGHGLGDQFDYETALIEHRVRPPLDHPEPSRCLISVTGLTHLGSAKSRAAMHAKLAAEDLSDSMRMFKLGLEGGKPEAGVIGVQPEWAYKGDGSWAVSPEQSIAWPWYAEDGGDEAEIVGLYVIGDAGEVLRVGFALGNEYSDHALEQKNYLYLAHSKLRQCSYGPEVLVGSLPQDVNGEVRVLRGENAVWTGNFISGEQNMSHSIANLEHHHFKYANFRRPGDVHVHFFGASVLSCSEGVKLQDGDAIEVECPAFGHRLRNTIRREEDSSLRKVQAL